MREGYYDTVILNPYPEQANRHYYDAWDSMYENEI